MRNIARNALYDVLHAIGVTFFWRWCNRRKLTAICIHGVERDQRRSGIAPTRWQLSEAVLDRQLEILKRAYEFVSVEDALKVLDGKLKTRKPCALFTMDDGYCSSFEIAWPLLKRHGIPAIVFVASKHMETKKPFWWDRLDYVFLQLPADLKQIQLGDHQIEVNLSCRKSRGDSARYVTRLSRSLFDNEHARLAALEMLIQEHETPAGLHHLNSWVGVMGTEEVADASNDGLEIGSHTVNHFRLSDLDRATVNSELRASKAAIEKETGKECRFFCFPEGSLSSSSIEDTRSAGYKCAFSSHKGLNGRGANRFALKRIHLPRTADAGYLLAHVSGLALMMFKFREKIVPGRLKRI